MPDRDRQSYAETSAGSELPRLVALQEVKRDFKVSENDPDPRGWDVQTSDNVVIGKVDDLIVDTVAMKVRYLTVELDGDVIGADDRHVLIPIGEARLDESADDVWVNLDAARMASLPEYDSSLFNRDYEDSVRDRFRTADTTRSTESATTGATTGALSGAAADATAGDYYSGREFDESRFYGSRRRGREDERSLTLAEEQLAVGKREVSGGEARVRKTVETERVSQSVPVEHEEVTVERRPISADATTDRDLDLGEDEIRIPLKAEELVVDKRVVPTEEVVVKKRVVREERTVEADLKKERLDVDSDADLRPDDRV